MEDLDASSEPPDPPQPCAIDVLDPGSLLAGGERRWLLERAGEAMAELGAGGEVRIALVDDETMSERHERDAGVAGTTDVLTYDLAGDSEQTRALDVDVIVCVDEARRQAESRGVAIERELLLYILHAALHCLGHDDHTDEGFRRMHEAEDRVLEAIGVGATFSLEAAPARGAGSVAGLADVGDVGGAS